MKYQVRSPQSHMSMGHIIPNLLGHFGDIFQMK